MRSGRIVRGAAVLGSLGWLLGACAAPQYDVAVAGDTAGPALPAPTATQPPRPAPGPRAQGLGAPRARPSATLPESDGPLLAATLPDALPEELEDSISETHTGLASWYGRRFHGRRTASGERFDMAALTAAHQTLPFGSRVRVTNLDNGRSVVVVINDRGPFVKSRVIDLSHAAAEELGFIQDGLAKVRIEVLSGPTG